VPRHISIYRKIACHNKEAVTIHRAPSVRSPPLGGPPCTIVTGKFVGLPKSGNVVQVL